MRKWYLLAACALILASCSKSSTNETANTNVSELKGIYEGMAELFGPVSCLKREGNQRVYVTINNSKQVSVGYHTWHTLGALIEFPAVTADLVAVKNNVYYFKIQPLNTSVCRAWPEDCKTADGIQYNIAISKSGSIDARMGYYSYASPQGEQYFAYNGAKMP